MSTSERSSDSIGEVIVLHEAELIDPRQRGGRLRAYCPIHGGDHQRSLSIACDGDAAGYGYCHSCHARVFVPELAPPNARGPRTPRHVTAATLLRQRQAPTPDAPATWQVDELRTLHRLAERMRERLADERPRAYLAARGIPYDLAGAAGVGYIPADARLEGGMRKWRDRLVFPLGSPAGAGYYGRSIHGWQRGGDVNEHAARLKDKKRATNDVAAWGHCHEKTYPAGWYGYDALATARQMVLCEGALDRLALVAARGLELADVVALIGTAARAEWIPANVRGVVLALDGDAAGLARAQALARELRDVGLAAEICAPSSEDRLGKDWSERWRVAQLEGVLPVLEAYDALAD